MKETGDIWLMAFLRLKGHPIQKVLVDRGKVRCQFELSDAQWQELKMEYAMSECARIRAMVEQLKELGK